MPLHPAQIQQEKPLYNIHTFVFRPDPPNISHTDSL